MPRNILWLMTDQHRLDCVGAYGGGQVRTPHLDRLAEQSVVFERHYSTCPLCGPARSSLHTGRYSHSCGALVNGFSGGEREASMLNEDEVTLPELLSQAGYHVGHIGVDHVRADPPLKDRGCFARYISNGDHQRYAKAKGLEFPDMRDHQRPCPTRFGDELRTVRYSSPVPGHHPFDPEDYLDVYYAREAASFITDAPADKPFLLLCFLWLPHPPFVIPEPYYSMYSPDEIEFPANVAGTQSGKPDMHMRHTPGQTGADWSLSDWRKTWAAYFGCVTLVDECIGMVLQALHKRGAEDDTLIAFHPDHGEMLGAHGYFQKMVCYEEAIHLPLIIRAPGCPPGRRNCLTSHVDVMPTLLDYAGVAIPESVQGKSLDPVLQGEEQGHAEAVFSEYNGNVVPDLYQRAVVSGDYKYIWNHEDIDELYDLREDPGEMRNLASTPGEETVRKHLRSLLDDWMQDTGDFLTLN